MNEAYGVPGYPSMLLIARLHADFFVDGLLLGAGEDPSLYDGDDGSAVEPSSWGRIKASFR